MKTETRFTPQTSRTDMDLILKIVNRAKGKFWLSNGQRFGLLLDIEFTHALTPLDLSGLLAASPFEFSHDVGGILRHFNRDTRQMDNCFTPRFTLN